MTIQELLQECDSHKVASLWAKKEREYGQLLDVDKLAEQVEKFCTMLADLTAEPTRDVVLALPSYQDESAEAARFQYDTVAEVFPQLARQCVPQLSENAPERELDVVMDAVRDWMPEAYSIESSDWEEVLGAQVCLPNVEKFGKDAFLSSVLFQMSMFGMEREARKKRLTEIAEKLKEAEQSQSDPDVHGYTLEEVRRHLADEFGFTYHEETEADKHKRHLKLVRIFCARLMELQRVALSGTVIEVRKDESLYDIQCAFDAETDEWVYTISMPIEDQKRLEEICAAQHTTIQGLFDRFFDWLIREPEAAIQWLMGGKDAVEKDVEV